MWTPALHCTDPEPGPGTGCARLWPECQVRWCEGEGPPPAWHRLVNPGPAHEGALAGHSPTTTCGIAQEGRQCAGRHPGRGSACRAMLPRLTRCARTPCMARCSWERACRQQRTMHHGTGPCVTLYSARAAAASPGFVALATLPRTKATCRCRCRCSRCSAYRTEASTDTNRPAIQGAVRAQCTWISACFRAENL